MKQEMSTYTTEACPQSEGQHPPEKEKIFFFSISHFVIIKITTQKKITKFFVDFHHKTNVA